MPARRARAGPGELIRIHSLLGADQRAGFAAQALRARDRAIGRALGDAAPPLARVLAWLHARERDARESGEPGAMRALCAACAVLGLALGAAAASGAFFYEGSGRVNVLLVLALFVLLPLASLLPFALAAAARRAPRGISPGRLGLALARALPAGEAGALARMATGSHGPGVAKWLLLTWSQWLAAGFGAGALAAAAALVLFTDLAFGWSTTLDPSPASVQRMCEALALPWRALVPAAVPDAALVEASRHFRIAAGEPPPDPVLLGRWWSFVVLSMLVYGLAPRLLTLALAHRRLSRACAAALLADHRVRDLLERMSTPLVETRSPDAEARPAPPASPVHLAALPQAEGWHAVRWAALPLEEPQLAALLGGRPLLGVHAAGSPRSTAEDRALAHSLAGSPPGTGILVLARAFEPPTLDLADFLAELRAAAPSAPIAVLPVALDGGAPAPPQAAHLEVWREALAEAAGDGIEAVHLAPAAPS